MPIFKHNDEQPSGGGSIGGDNKGLIVAIVFGLMLMAIVYHLNK